MIAYDLKCANGHVFEGWFDGPRAFKVQHQRGMISCPVCNSAEVIRIPSTFAIKSAEPAALPNREPSSRDLAKVQSKIVDFIEKNFHNVGTDFAKEALKIHYGAAEPRNIRGTSTDTEEETLKKEGIEFFKIPLPARPESDA